MHTIWHRFYFKYHKEDYEKSLAIHQRILELLSAEHPDPETVDNVVREHIRSGYRRFIQYLEDQPA
jgi:DNA-binding GntR family transcriptional regulator